MPPKNIPRPKTLQKYVVMYLALDGALHFEQVEGSTPVLVPYTEDMGDDTPTVFRFQRKELPLYEHVARLAQKDMDSKCDTNLR